MIPTYNPLHAIYQVHQTLLFRGPHNQQSMDVFVFHITCKALKIAGNKNFTSKTHGNIVKVTEPCHFSPWVLAN